MKRLWSQEITRWACLLAYLVVTATSGGAIVLCEGVDGHVTIEMASTPCSGSTTSETASDSSVDGSQPGCNDTLLTAGIQENTHSRLDRDKMPRPFAFSVLVPAAWVTDRPTSKHQTDDGQPMADHRTLTSLRSVVLLI